MYSFALPYSRLRTTYDSDRNDRNYPSSASSSSSSGRRLTHHNDSEPRRHRPTLTSRNLGLSTNPGTMAAASKTSSDSSSSNVTVPPRRPQRYGRSSTISVTQMLTDSCSSLLQKLTTRVRGPSATTNDNSSPQSPSVNNNDSLLGSTRSRLEDKYSAVLEKLAGKRREPDKGNAEPSAPSSLAKSATSVAIGDRAYPHLSGVVREKTPYRSHAHHHNDDSHDYLDRNSAYRVRHKSNNNESARPRRISRQVRAGKSENGERRNNTENLLKLCPVEIPESTLYEEQIPSYRDEITPTNCAVPAPPAASVDNLVDPMIAEREAKRKEIQSLIMKYSALDEAYNRATNSTAVQAESSSTATPAVSATTAIAQKYSQVLPSSSAVALTVSTMAMCGRPLLLAVSCGALSLNPAACSATNTCASVSAPLRCL